MGDWDETEAERREFADFLEALEPEQWDSVIPGKELRVRDVAAHVIQGATQSPGRALLGIAGHGFRFNAYYDDLARQRGAAAPAELVEQMRAAASSRHRLVGLPGPKAGVMLAETVTHHQEVRDHLGAPRKIPPQRMVTVLDVVKDIGFPVGAKKRVSGLTLRATDLDWSSGTGPEVKGPAEAIFHTMLKHPNMVDRLDGDGAPILIARIT